MVSTPSLVSGHGDETGVDDLIWSNMILQTPQSDPKSSHSHNGGGSLTTSGLGTLDSLTSNTGISKSHGFDNMLSVSSLTKCLSI